MFFVAREKVSELSSADGGAASRTNKLTAWYGLFLIGGLLSGGRIFSRTFRILICGGGLRKTGRWRSGTLRWLCCCYARTN